MDNFGQSLSKTVYRFNKYIKPILSDVVKAELVSIEEMTDNRLAEKLDIFAGIDIWCIDKIGMYGIGSRLQTSTKSWRTFTVRKDRDSGTRTEYEKRRHAIENNYLYPKLTLQGYFTKNDELLEFAVAETKDVISYIEDGHAIVRHTGNEQVGQASFYAVHWDKFKECCNDIFIHQHR